MYYCFEMKILNYCFSAIVILLIYNARLLVYECILLGAQSFVYAIFAFGCKEGSISLLEFNLIVI